MFSLLLVQGEIFGDLSLCHISLNNIKLLSYCSRGQKSNTVHTRQKSKFWQGCGSRKENIKAPGKKIYFLCVCFSTSRGHLHDLTLCPYSPFFKGSRTASSHHFLTLTFCFPHQSPPSYTFKVPRDYTGSLQ